jgi:hypothetical protein
MLRLWDTDFRSLKALSRDPRCKTSYTTLQTLLRWGVPLEAAVVPPTTTGVPPVVVWGETFPNYSAVARDPRCGVPYVTMMSRIKKKNWPVEQAVISAKQLVCWGEAFRSVRALALDPRCQVRYAVLLKNLGDGQSPEQATSKLPLGLEPKDGP